MPGSSSLTPWAACPSVSGSAPRTETVSLRSNRGAAWRARSGPRASPGRKAWSQTREAAHRLKPRAIRPLTQPGAETSPFRSSSQMRSLWGRRWQQPFSSRRLCSAVFVGQPLGRSRLHCLRPSRTKTATPIAAAMKAKTSHLSSPTPWVSHFTTHPPEAISVPTATVRWSLLTAAALLLQQRDSGHA